MSVEHTWLVSCSKIYYQDTDSDCYTYKHTTRKASDDRIRYWPEIAFPDKKKQQDYIWHWNKKTYTVRIAIYVDIRSPVIVRAILAFRTFEIKAGFFASTDAPCSANDPSLDFALWSTETISIYIQTVGREKYSFDKNISYMISNWMSFLKEMIFTTSLFNQCSQSAEAAF